MIYYFYSKDYYGHERCYRLFDEEELVDDMVALLDNLADPDFMPVEIMYGEDWRGYDSLDAFIANEADDPEAMLWVQAVVAGEECYGYPFCIISHFNQDNGQYEVCEPENVDWQGLIDEYSDSHAYQIKPCYYQEDRITVEEAEQMGAKKLAELLREDLDKDKE